MRFSENGCTKILAFQQCNDVAEILNGITSVRQFLQLPSFWNLKSSENDIIFLRQITSSFSNDFNFPLTAGFKVTVLYKAIISKTVHFRDKVTVRC